MDQPTALQTLMGQHAERTAPHADAFARMTRTATESQEEHFRQLAKKYERRNESAPLDLDSSAQEAPDARLEAYHQRILSRAEAQVIRPSIPVESRVAMANTLQPVRDSVVDGVIVLSQDRLLDLIGPPYPDTWTQRDGNIFSPQHTVWADRAFGSIGFDHLASGSSIGRQGNSGAGIFVQFVPRIAPGVAQVRPFVPYSYQWLSSSFKSREDNLATFGVRVLSCDLAGGDLTIEQDYRYVLWNDSAASGYAGAVSSPSWFEDESNNVPEWDSDNAFLWGKEAPYFKTRPNRIYSAAIWCFGMVWSISHRSTAGVAIGRLQAKVPWVVIGYQ